jgi:UDP-N-acetylglucosamine--N-acetylmuramyl-(pentapeptide) pyrophosphoryl-undecaprenol N-acetylglucosamine transferase
MREEVEARYRALGMEAQVVSFLDDMAGAFSSAALVIARAGATTLAELCAIGRPAILIPYPHAADDHQARNAEELERAGAAVAIRESALSVEALSTHVSELLASPTRRRAMSEAARAQGRPDAAASIVDDMCEWLGCPPASPQAEVEGASSRRGGGGPTHGLRVSSGGREPYVPSFSHRSSLGVAPRSRRPLVLDGRPWE